MLRMSNIYLNKWNANHKQLGQLKFNNIEQDHTTQDCTARIGKYILKEIKWSQLGLWSL